MPEPEHTQAEAEAAPQEHTATAREREHGYTNGHDKSGQDAHAGSRDGRAEASEADNSKSAEERHGSAVGGTAATLASLHRQDGESHATEGQERYRFAPIESIPGRDFDTPPVEDFKTLEEARAAVRGVFSSLNDTVRDPKGKLHGGPVLGASSEAQSEAGWYATDFRRPDASGELVHAERDSEWHHPENEEEPVIENETEEAASHESLREPEYQEASSDEDETHASDYEPATVTSLTGTGTGAATARPATDAETDDAIRAALTRHYARDRLEPVEPPSFEERADGPAFDENDDLARKLEAQLKSPPRFRPPVIEEREDENGRISLVERPSFPLDDLSRESANGTLEPNDDTRDQGDANQVDPNLLRQLERTKTGEETEPKRRGGLLLAAAWGMFLSIAAGLIGGVFAFRDMTAQAFPGLAPVYRTLGMPVTVQPLQFDNVSYTWSVSDQSPVLVVSGTIINNANRKVGTPNFFVLVKDQDPQLDREYSVPFPVEGNKLRAKQQADFQIELVSPSRTMTAVELELRNVR
jgi:hypothetical protein